MSGEQLMGLIKSMGNEVLSDPALIEKKRVVSPSTASNSGSESSVVIHKPNQYKKSPMPGRSHQLSLAHDVHDDGDEEANEKEDQRALRTQTKNARLTVDEDKEDEDFNDYVIEPPLPPPKELHPDKLYGLFEFRGDDPSHCEIERDDAVVLLNDQDSYWWLIRREHDGKIGFAPAECLETYQERLARLNCWKNEEVEKSSKENLNYPAEKEKSIKVNKSVSFSNEIDVAEQFYSDTSPESYLGESEPENEDTGDEEVESDHLDFNYEAPYHPEEGEIVSDDIPVTPLSLQKRNEIQIANNGDLTSNTRSITTHLPTHLPTSIYQESDVEESPFIAPNAFFQGNNYSGSIGSYSPSSSEMDSPESTPPLSQYRRKPPKFDESEIKGNIPQSRGTRDIAYSMKMLDELINDELNTPGTLGDDDEVLTEKEEDHNHSTDTSNADLTLTYDENDEFKLSSPIEISSQQKNLSNITESTFTNSNTSLHLTSTHTSVDEESTEPGSASISTSTSLLEQSTETVSKSPSTPKIHQDIDSIFKDSLSEIDDLQERLKRLQARLK